MEFSALVCLFLFRLFWLRQICWAVEKKTLSMAPEKAMKKKPASLEKGAKGKALEKAKAKKQTFGKG